MKVLRADRAKEDLRNIRAYFDEKNAVAGRALAERIRAKLGLLKQNPRMGRAVDERTGVRELVVDDYVLPYVIEADAIIILRVFHGAQDR